ncbi:MAG TPA: hypothetical protein VFE79_18525 [Paraburkholderia sp.]|jgi:hypothetical protein|nr:hypothetical protein [Paraburkholderia sp.]
MKIRRAELLVAVAIVTSAAVMQIREHVLPHEAQMGDAPSASCGVKHDGLVPAGCEPTRDEQPVDRPAQARHAAPQVWV